MGVKLFYHLIIKNLVNFFIVKLTLFSSAAELSVAE